MSHDLYPTARPEDFAVAPDAIRRTVHEIRQVRHLELHSFLLLRKGVLLWEEYFREGEKNRLHVMHSVSKSFTSAAIGLAQAEGLLSIEDKLYDFFPAHAGLCDSDYKRELTLRHLLMMGSGFENREEELFNADADPVKAALSMPVLHKPGTVFDYYTFGTYLLSVVFSKVNPEGVHAYLRKKLFEPMGFGASHWNVDDSCVPWGGFGLYLTAYDMTRLGQLCLQNGAWGGQQLLPGAYIHDATAKQIGNFSEGRQDWSAGYGYQFWRNAMGGYRADGMHGQYIIVLPEQQSVIVMTSHLQDMQVPLAAIGTHLLPAMNPSF